MRVALKSCPSESRQVYMQKAIQTHVQVLEQVYVVEQFFSLSVIYVVIQLLAFSSMFIILVSYEETKK